MTGMTSLLVGRHMLSAHQDAKVIFLSKLELHVRANHEEITTTIGVVEPTISMGTIGVELRIVIIQTLQDCLFPEVKTTQATPKLRRQVFDRNWLEA